MGEKISNYTKEATDAFLSVYREMENEDTGRYEAVRKQYKDEIDLYRTLRNCLTHDEVEGEYPFLVSEKLVEQAKEILSLMKRNAGDICIKREVLLTASLSDRLISAISVMSKKDFSYLPILDENDVLQYVFSLNSIVEILASGHYNKNAPLEEYTAYIGIKNRNEYYGFVKTEEMAVNVKSLFEKKNKKSSPNEVNIKAIPAFGSTAYSFYHRKNFPNITVGKTQ